MSVCLLACMCAFVREYVLSLFGTLGEGDGFFRNNVFKCIAEGIRLIEHHSMEIQFRDLCSAAINPESS